MICINDCNKTKCLNAPNACQDTQTLAIGLLTPDTGYTVYIEDNNRSYRTFQEVSTDGAGLLTIDLNSPDALFYHENSTFLLWVTQRDADISKLETITIGADEADCLVLKFQSVRDESGDAVTLEYQEIQLI